MSELSFSTALFFKGIHSEWGITPDELLAATNSEEELQRVLLWIDGECYHTPLVILRRSAWGRTVTRLLEVLREFRIEGRDTLDNLDDAIARFRALQDTVPSMSGQGADLIDFDGEQSGQMELLSDEVRLQRDTGSTAFRPPTGWQIHAHDSSRTSGTGISAFAGYGAPPLQEPLNPSEVERAFRDGYVSSTDPTW